MFSCDNDSDTERQTKSALYGDHIISRYTTQIQTDMYTYILIHTRCIHIHTDTNRYIQIQVPANHGREGLLRGKWQGWGNSDTQYRLRLHEIGSMRWDLYRGAPLWSVKGASGTCGQKISYAIHADTCMIRQDTYSTYS